MNRIYQGRVTSVEMLDATSDKEKWIIFHNDPKRAQFLTQRIPELRIMTETERVKRSKLTKEDRAQRHKSKELQEYEQLRVEQREEWQTFLWRHHEMFQDDVNYLYAAFATLVPDNCKDNVWKDYRAAIERSWELYTGRQGTWNHPFQNACSLVGCKKDASFKEFQRKLSSLTGSKASKIQKFKALKQILESAIEIAENLQDPDQPIEGALKGKVKDLFGSALVNLCAQKTNVTPRNVIAKQRAHASQCTRNVVKGGGLEWKDVFSFKTDTSTGAWSREEATKNIVQCLEKLIEEVEERADKAKTNDKKIKMSNLAGRLEKQKSLLQTWCNNPKTLLPTTEPTRKGSGGYDLKSAILFSLRPDLDGFRDAFLLFNQVRLKEEVTVSTDSDAAYDARTAGGSAHPVFPFYCDLITKRINDKNIGQGVWPDFEKQAFSEVFTKIGQFIIRERKFELRLAKANDIIAKIDKQKISDTRLQAIERIAGALADELPDTAVDENGQRRPYGIRDRTLKGWRKIRPAWQDALIKTSDLSADDLIKLKNQLQNRHREKYGSAALFDRLAKEPSIWNHDDKEDAVETWAKYVENIEEKAHLEAERLFAPAHATFSPRYYRWSETNNKEHLVTSAPGIPFAFEADVLDFTKKEKTQIKINFWSPRLLRDELRSENEKLDKDHPDMTWMPPVLRAFVKAHEWPCDKQTFAGTSVRLAPRCKENIQLVFEPELKTEVLSSRWKKEFPCSPAKNKESDAVGLFWPRNKGDEVLWFNRGEIRVLGVDLGLTNSAAWQILQASNNERLINTKRLHHQLNPDSEKNAWFAHSIANGIIRIAGEDRWCWREFVHNEKDKLQAKLKKSSKDRNAFCRKFLTINRGIQFEDATHAFLPELSGSSGRTATNEETTEAEKIFDNFKTKGFDIVDSHQDWKTKLSFPQQNDELLWGLKRVRSQLFRLNHWSEQLVSKNNQKSYQSAIETVGNLRNDDPLIELKVLTSEPKKLKNSIAALAKEYLDCFKNTLPRLADRILPWRRGHWTWKPYENGWHKMELDKSKPRPDALLAGQRGVSLIRLNQLKDLRQLAQSLNHLCRHKPTTRGEIIPEPFEDCRQAMEDAREDRAKQIAHEIFAIALGVELAPPPNDKHARKNTESLHGIYRCLERGPVNFIALENLKEYKPSSKQGRRENRQLSSWSHRRIHKILIELCELVGLPIVLVDPSFTSRFSAKDHSIGFRAEEVSNNDPRHSFWQRKANEEPDGWQAEFLSLLDKLPDKKSLLLPKEGGEFFVSLGNDHSTYHADLNAAYRIALRALAHRDRVELFGQAWIKKKPYLIDIANVFSDSILREGCSFRTIPNSERLWESVTGDRAWQRCKEINLARLANWNEDDDVPV